MQALVCWSDELQRLTHTESKSDTEKGTDDQADHGGETQG